MKYLLYSRENEFTITTCNMNESYKYNIEWKKQSQDYFSISFM